MTLGSHWWMSRVNTNRWDVLPRLDENSHVFASTYLGMDGVGRIHLRVVRSESTNLDFERSVNVLFRFE